MEQEFPLETSRPEKRRLPFPDVPLPQEILHWKDQKSRFPLFGADFQETFGTW